ncbi:MAG: hypothetical protein ACFFCQ_03820 [Promethearchaeota archaeon]
MATKEVTVSKMQMVPIRDVKNNLQGFYVTGLKGKGGKSGKIGFLLSGVRLIAVQHEGRVRSRTRIKWFSTGFEIREEIHPLLDAIRKNTVIMINFDDPEAVVVQGEPHLQKRTFKGQVIEITWSEAKITIKPEARQGNLLCTRNQKLKKIEAIVR